jgi:hypothetical protein
MCFNPVSIIGFTIVLWKFFAGRIEYEEFYLIKFFGQDYIDYINKVGILLPCIIKNYLFIVINIDKGEQMRALEIHKRLKKIQETNQTLNDE